MLQLTPEEISKIINFGALGYQADRMIPVLRWDEQKFAEVAMVFDQQSNEYVWNTESVFFKYYEQGRIDADYLIDTKLIEKSYEGELPAIKAFTERREKYKIGG